MTEINKEIEEMASIMCGHKRTCQDCLRECTRFGFAFDCECLPFAEKVYKKGYRKQSDTIKEVAEKLKIKLTDKSGWVTYKCQDLCWDIDKIAKEFGVEVEKC